MKDLNQLALIVASAAELSENALTLADEKNLTAYDACYAVLAKKLNLPLVTADARLANSAHRTVWIGELEV